jgi:phosphate transport system permease protein
MTEAISYPSPGLPSPPPLASSELFVRAGRRVDVDVIMAAFTRGAAVSILLLLVSLIAVLGYGARESIRAFGWHFLTNQTWRPNELEHPKKDAKGHIMRDEDGETIMETVPPSFGALPTIYGTAVSSAIALLFAVPLSFGAAIFLVRVAPKFLVAPVSFLIEFLAAIPSIAYGLWGLFVLSPLLRIHFEPMLQRTFSHVWGLNRLVTGATGKPVPITGRDMLCGGMVLGIMIVPIITAISRDVLSSVPRAQIEGTIALGATWWQSAVEMLKFSRSALFGAVMLGLARAAGETMAITMVIGNNNQIASSPLAPAQTMSSLLANEFAEANGIHSSALVEVALILLVMSLVFNVIARWLVVGKNARTSAAH